MQFFEQNTLYIVLVISIIIWLGIFYYLFQIDKKITKLEKMAEVSNFNQNNE